MPKNFEITDENAAVLRSGPRNDRFNAITECPMSENVIAYALEELEPGASSDVKDHLAICRVCADLAQDVRSAADESQQQDNQPVEVLPAVARAIRRSKKPSFLRKMRILIPDLSMPPIYPRIAAAVAIACLVFVVIQYGFRNMINFASYPNAVEEMPAGRKKLTPPQQTSDQINPLKISAKGPYSINSITDSRHQLTDPFEPLIGTEIPPSIVKKKRTPRVPLTPLEKLDLSQLKLVGIILSEHGNKAMVEDATGKGYVLKEGTNIGRNFGRVARILKEKVIIEEKLKDSYGKIYLAEKELRLNKVD